MSRHAEGGEGGNVAGGSGRIFLKAYFVSSDLLVGELDVLRGAKPLGLLVLPIPGILIFFDILPQPVHGFRPEIQPF